MSGAGNAYDKVMLARSKGRPTGISFIENIFEDFIELHGDRRFADDPAVVGLPHWAACLLQSSPLRRALTPKSAFAGTSA